ncbi:MAG: M20/M25/M40 family metallo-hydrolase [Alphaproteobacteria bacterium]|nr:M20/M25/M40 family metallo-hydrolase [Alphaproteobacteria bacterium]
MFALLMLACAPSGQLALDPDPTAVDSGAADSAAPLALSEAVTRQGFEAHLAAFQEISDAYGGNRALGSDGYAASVDYAAEVLEAAGYAVERWPFSMSSYDVVGTPSLSLGEEAWTYDRDFSVLYYSGGGEVSGPIVPVAVQLPPEGEANTTDSGCQASDFQGFPEGGVALIQRGGCTFTDKAENAFAAGAVGVIVFNEGQSERQGLFGGTLSDISPGPVLSASYALGEALAAAEGQTVSLSLEAGIIEVESWNLIAELGEAGPVVMLGAHLDSVSAGAGMNDNASGSAAVLELAERAAELGPPPERRLRFALWGAEEEGLVGSRRWVDAQRGLRGELLAYLNFDMIASPNGAAFVYDGDGDDTRTEAGPAGSAEIEALFTDYLELRGYPARPVSLDGRSDYYGFWEAGVPNGGLFTGAEGAMSRAEAEAWGGEVGEAYDACYHRQCDDWENLDLDLGEEMMRAAGHVAETLAMEGLVEPAPAGPPGPWTRTLDRQGHDWLR